MIFSFIKGKEKNIFVSFLKLLGVRHSECFSNKYYGEHPYKYSLFGLSQMLSDYGVENTGVKIKNKKGAIFSLEVPFIAHTGNDFVTVFKITSKKIYYIWYGREISTSIDEFSKIWTGIALLAEPDENSIEPNYKENRKKDFFYLARKYLLILSISVLIILSYISHQICNNLGLTLAIIINLMGVYIGYLLVLKQMYIHSNYADKVCSLFKRGDCNDILESKAAKLWGVIGWSEIGLGYFTSNVILILFVPKLISYLSIINICALPYSFWSIWYQKVVVKQWCPLCLIIQVLLWGIFIITLLFSFIQFFKLNINDTLLVGIIYITPVLVANILLPKLIKGNKVEQIIQEINSLKATNEVFFALLKIQPHYQINKLTSKIFFGNPAAKTLITIFTNPHCEPCSKMHVRVEKLLKETNNNLCVQYVFSAFNKELESSNKFLIAAYLNNEISLVKEIYNEWFKNGKYKREDFFKKYNYNLNDRELNKEFISHEEWKERNKLRATPTILINGYKLPYNYKIEDLRYFYELDFNIK